MADAAQNWQRQCAEYVGRWRQRDDCLAPEAAQLFQACLNSGPGARQTLDEGMPLPPLWHWLYFHEAVTQADIGDDGHEKRGIFLPPVPYPRRMWAASRVSFRAPLLLGERASKCSTIKTVEFKEGRSGLLCFVSVEHSYTQGGAEKIHEAQTLVYREDGDARPGAPSPEWDNAVAGDDAAYSVDAALLFRYSALTFNAHRIHYDREYARYVEGYPGLVVHGPLLATLLMNCAVERVGDKPLCRFEFRALGPVFEDQRFFVDIADGDDEMELRIVKSNGDQAMRATIGWAP